MGGGLWPPGFTHCKVAVPPDDDRNACDTILASPAALKLAIDRAIEMIKYFLVIIPIFIVLVPNVYASGPRLDYDERYEDVPGAPECWVDGYDSGFAQKYDKDRADECNDIPGDQYKASWKYGCMDSGLTKIDCNQIKDNPVSLEHESLQEENRRSCYDKGFEDGNSSVAFNKDRDHGCSEYSDSYRYGFKVGCVLVEGNTDDSCELTIKGHATYCPFNPDDPACTEFLHDASNKQPHSTIGACGQAALSSWLSSNSKS